MTTSSMLFAKNLNQFQKNNADYGKRCTNTLRGKTAGSCPSRGLKVLRLEIPHGFIIAKQAFGIRLCAPPRGYRNKNYAKRQLCAGRYCRDHAAGEMIDA